MPMLWAVISPLLMLADEEADVLREVVELLGVLEITGQTSFL